MLDAMEINKSRVASQFSRAAARYDEAAQVQIDIASDALQLLGNRVPRILDIGCGTGRVTRQLLGFADTIHAIDLAPGMIDFARQHNGAGVEYLTGDAENLPFSQHSFDSVFSTMALQWCSSVESVMEEIYRVLSPNGNAVLAIMSAGSMFELERSWRQIDCHSHVNRFRDKNTLAMVAQQSGFEVEISEKSYVTWHENVRSLLASIKSIGANVVNETGNKHPLKKSSLSALQQRYSDNFAQATLLPLTYKVCFLQLRKLVDA